MTPRGDKMAPLRLNKLYVCNMTLRRVILPMDHVTIYFTSLRLPFAVEQGHFSNRRED